MEAVIEIRIVCEIDNWFSFKLEVPKDEELTLDYIQSLQEPNRMIRQQLRRTVGSFECCKDDLVTKFSGLAFESFDKPENCTVCSISYPL